MATNQTAGSRFLQGNYAPVGREITATDLPVKGRIPEALRGRFVKNGPNPARTRGMGGPEGRGGRASGGGAYHWFTGDGMVHGVELRDGAAVSYRNRWVRTAKFAAQTGATDPGGPDDALPEVNPANTSLVAHAGKLLALCEIGLPYELTPDLDTVGRYDFGGRLVPPMTAHPKVDPVTGELLFFGYTFTPPFMRFHVAAPDGELVRSEDVPLRGPALVHDFAVTANYVVFFDFPLLFDMELVGKATMPYAWHPEYGARVGVMPRTGGAEQIQWIEIEPCYVWHGLNAFEDPQGRVTVDVLRYEDMFVEGAEELNARRLPALERWVVDAAAGHITQQRLDDRPFDFPKIDDRRTGYPHRFGYGVELGATGGQLDLGGLLKYDLTTGMAERHDPGPRAAAAEGIFVPAADDADEDEGWVLTFFYDGEAEATDLVILDARDFAGEPVARVRLPQRVPYGFHSAWIPD